MRTAGSSSDRPGASRARICPSQPIASPPASSTSRNSESGACAQRGGAAVQLVAQAALGGCEQQALVGEARGRIDPELESGQMADRLGPDADLAVRGDGHRQRVGAARADVAHQHRGAAVDEALGQPLVQRVATAALRPRAFARPIWRGRRASRSAGRYRPSCGFRRAGRPVPRYRPRHCRAAPPRRRTIRAGCARPRRYS